MQLKALLFATKAHAGQYRKYTNEHYIVHPIEVANLVEDVGGTDEMIAAAYLHDVVEDCHVTFGDLRREGFSEKVIQYVNELTDVSKPSDGSRKMRKLLDREYTAMASPEAKTIKLADLISNSRSIIEHDKNFAKVYMREKSELLKVLSEGNEELYFEALTIVEDYYREKNTDENV